MNLQKSVQLMKKYTFCGDCGSDCIGNGEGTLEIRETFKRTCKCGWSVEVSENDDGRGAS